MSKKARLVSKKAKRMTHIGSRLGKWFKVAYLKAKPPLLNWWELSL